MRRAVVPGIRRRIAGESGRRRVAGAVAAIVAVAVAIGALLSAGLPGSSRGATSPRKSSGSATVERRDLIATDTVAGTLSYAKPQTVFNRTSGTLTALPAVGAVVRPGHTLYRVDGAPVVLFDGTVPAYRTLTSGVTDGPDVQELKQNLIALGFDPSHQITVNQTFDSATVTAIDAWQASLGQTQTGTVTLGQVVFLPGPQRITAVDAVLGSTGGSSGGSSSGSSSTSGAAAAASRTTSSATSYSPAPHTEFVSFTTTSAATSPTPPSTTTPGTTAPSATASASSPPATGSPGSTEATTKTTCPATPPDPTKTTTGPSAPSACSKPGSPTAQQLLAQLVAELKKLASSSSGSSGRSAGSASGSSATGGSGSGRSSGGGGGGAGISSSAATGGGSGGGGSSGGSSSAGTSSAGSGAATPILQTTSTQVIVSVALDATKQSEAVVGEPVTVQLPDGSTADGKVATVSPVAQTTSSSSSSSNSGGGGGSTTPSATIPVTVALSGHEPTGGLDQAAVSVNFQQQVERNVLSVPVTALLATAGGRYAVQEAAAPHNLIPVTPGLFAAGFVQVSGAQIYPGLQVTDSQG